MTSKNCIKCNTIKHITFFHVNNKRKDGLCAYCKECIKKYQAVYYKTPNGIASIKRGAKKYNASDKFKKSHKKYRESEKGRNYKKKNILINENMINAHNLVHNAIRSNKVIRQNKCSKCNSTENIEGHHCDYDKPYYLLWLCLECHKLWHRKYGKGLNSNKSGEYNVPC